MGLFLDPISRHVRLCRHVGSARESVIWMGCLLLFDQLLARVEDHSIHSLSWYEMWREAGIFLQTFHLQMQLMPSSRITGSISGYIQSSRNFHQPILQPLSANSVIIALHPSLNSSKLGNFLIFMKKILMLKF